MCVKMRWTDKDFMLSSAGCKMIGWVVMGGGGGDFFGEAVEGRMFLNLHPGEASAKGLST